MQSVYVPDPLLVPNLRPPPVPVFFIYDQSLVLGKSILPIKDNKDPLNVKLDSPLIKPAVPVAVIT